MNSGKSNLIILEYQRFAQSGCEDIMIRKFRVVPKTQFLTEYI